MNSLGLPEKRVRSIESFDWNGDNRPPSAGANAEAAAREEGSGRYPAFSSAGRLAATRKRIEERQRDPKKLVDWKLYEARLLRVLDRGETDDRVVVDDATQAEEWLVSSGASPDATVVGRNAFIEATS